MRKNRRPWTVAGSKTKGRTMPVHSPAHLSWCEVPPSRCGRFVHEIGWYRCRPTRCWNGESQFRRRANFMRRRSFLCLCFRIFFRRFLTTLAIHTPSFLPRAEAENFSSNRGPLAKRHMMKQAPKLAEVTQRPKKCQEKARHWRSSCMCSVTLSNAKDQGACPERSEGNK